MYRGREASPFDPPERLTVRDAFRRYASIDIYDSLPINGGADTDTLARQAKNAGVRVAPDDDWSDIFSRILSERVEPNLGIGRPTVLHAYPASEAALAQVHPYDPRIAERFELYCCGVELANAFHELRDPDEQRRRFASSMNNNGAFSASPIPSTRISSPPSPTCRTQAGPRWASTGSSCSQPARNGSSPSSGLQCLIRRGKPMTLHSRLGLRCCEAIV